jgi:hypothetical protein
VGSVGRGKKQIYHSGSKGGVISTVLPNGKRPCSSEDKRINPRSHSYILQTGHKTVQMERKT